MTIDTLPVASDIRIESRLKPEQVSDAIADEMEFDADIESRIERHRAELEMKIAGVDTSSDKQIRATEAMQYRALASVFGSAGHLNRTYWDMSDRYMALYNDAVDDLLGTSPDTTAASELTAVTPRSHSVRANVLWP